MKKRRRIPLFFLALLALSAGRGSTAGPVSDWNVAARAAIRADRANPPQAAHALAMMHLAIDDAVRHDQLQAI